MREPPYDVETTSMSWKLENAKSNCRLLFRTLHVEGVQRNRLAVRNVIRKTKMVSPKTLRRWEKGRITLTPHGRSMGHAKNNLLCRFREGETPNKKVDFNILQHFCHKRHQPPHRRATGATAASTDRTTSGSLLGETGPGRQWTLSKHLENVPRYRTPQFKEFHLRCQSLHHPASLRSPLFTLTS
ncbi:uncharacterized protein TEOVI_000469900 [Trypanosoma equiperdum]|uniref:T. brucei spp.-specific protein n=2 Tax=Trypanozoon TaxID=39700 RepID=Q580E9_TRYB2|nr:hypothetical protein Tb927.4.1210 [Trypanosoma brucei brucei TREU927]AAX80901.1 hypothetical protein Tb927.4.1210 [Trypanosoma brucei]AAZ10712.1 hypothetical protein Tb927.4.1210 [Trypanosoma brucei brucei TREU927]SCU66784.1 hypothetical protein, conserved [Trypanosoma equiperdum]